MIGVLIFTIIGLVISIIIVTISNKLGNGVTKKEEIIKLLPHYNCGLCGFGSCDNMASKILEDNENVLKCKPLKEKEETLEEIKKILT